MSSRVRRRKAKHHRLAVLTPWQRWTLIHGPKCSNAFDSEAEWQQAYTLHRDALMAELPDPADSFRAFWLHDDVPDDLRRPELRQACYVLLDEPRRSEVRAEYLDLLERRRTWLREQGYR